MRRLTHLFLALAAVALVAAPATAQAKRTYTAQLTGREEVPMRDTRATGHVNFKLNKEGTELEYRDRVHAVHAAARVQLIRVSGRGFFDGLRGKLHWGE